MQKNPINKGMIESNSSGTGEISHQMVTERATELASIAGRPMTKADSEQALRELTGGDEIDAKQAFLESVSEVQRWNPYPGSTGHQAEMSPSEEEDDDGNSQAAQFVEEGINEAGHDQMRHAALDAEHENSKGS